MQLFPKPKKIIFGGNTFRIPKHPRITVICKSREHELLRTAKIIRSELKAAIPGAIVKSYSRNKCELKISLSCECRAPQAEAYELHIKRNNVQFSGTTWRGVLYACATFRQMLREDGVYTGILTDCVVKDYPDVAQRAASRWLIDLEGARMAYDWGEGRAATLALYREKIDFAMRHKINFVFFEGFTWEREKYPGYAADMKRLNRYAAERNVVLEYGGHGIGIGGRNPQYDEVISCGFVKGLGDVNRKSYPGGDIYPCSGRDSHPTRFNGSCRSNEALNDLKAVDIADYVRKLEPRALYIHHEDIGNNSVMRADWVNRCPECRRRWPSDEVADKNGAAGAVVHGMNRILDGIASVKNKRSGYDGARDCTVCFVLPGYGAGSLDDKAFGETLRYFGIASRLLHPSPNVFLAIREQFFADDGKTLRIAEAAKIVGKHGGHRLQVFAINGADYYLTDALFAPAALINGFYKGAGGIFNFSGTLFQEPQEVFNAECCWNLPTLNPSLVTYGKGEEKNTPLFYQIPNELSAEEGFISQFCRSFYGKKAGELMKRIILLGDSEATPMATLCFRFRKEGLFKNSTDLKDYDRKEMFRKWTRIHEVTCHACELAEQACSCRMDRLPSKTFRRFRDNLGFGEIVSGIIRDIFAESPDKKAISRELSDAGKYMEEHYRFDFISDKDGEHSLWGKYLKLLEQATNNLTDKD